MKSWREEEKKLQCIWQRLHFRSNYFIDFYFSFHAIALRLYSRKWVNLKFNLKYKIHKWLGRLQTKLFSRLRSIVSSLSQQQRHVFSNLHWFGFFYIILNLIQFVLQKCEREIISKICQKIFFLHNLRQNFICSFTL